MPARKQTKKEPEKVVLSAKQEKWVRVFTAIGTVLMGLVALLIVSVFIWIWIMDKRS